MSRFIFRFELLGFLVFGLISAFLLFPFFFAGIRIADLILLSLLFICLSNFLLVAKKVNVWCLIIFSFCMVPLAFNPNLFLLLIRWLLFFFLLKLFLNAYHDGAFNKIYFVFLILLVIELLVAFLQSHIGFLYFDDYGRAAYGVIARSSGLFGNSLYLGVFASILGMALVRVSENVAAKFMLFLAAALLIYLSGTRTAAVALSLSFAVQFLFPNKFFFKFVSFSLLFVPILLAILFYNTPVLLNEGSEYCFVMNENQYFDKSYGMRLEKLNYALFNIKEINLFGNGLGNCIGGGADMLFSRLINDFSILGFLIYFTLGYLVIYRLGKLCKALAINSLVFFLSFDLIYSLVGLLSILSAILLVDFKMKDLKS